MKRNKITLSIIFPNYNGGKEPLECLRSIAKLNYNKNGLEVIVIDNHSTDGSFEQIKNKFPKVITIRNHQNLGFAKAINMGLKISRGKHIFIGNDDIVFEKNSINNLLSYIKSDEKIGIAGGKIFYKDESRKICSSGYYMNKWTGDVKTGQEPNKIKDPDWLQGCALLVPRKIIDTVGFLDPNYKLSFDDYDLCMRVKKAGFKVKYYPKAVFYHGESKTVNKDLSHKYFHWYKSKIRFLIKNYPIQNAIFIILFQTLLITPYRAIFLRDKRLVPYIKAMIWNFQNFQNTYASKSLKFNEK